MDGLFKSLNLPAQIAGFMSNIFGPSESEIGEIFAEKLRYQRLKNEVSIFTKSKKLLEQNNLKIRNLNLKTLVPLLENSSLEDDELLQTKWANLIANICSSPETGLEPKLVKTLSNLSPLEARVLDYIFERFQVERKERFEHSKKYKYFIYKSEEDINSESVVINKHIVQSSFNLTEQFIKICIDNLESLGLIRFTEPEIEITKDAVNHDDEDKNKLGVQKEYDFDISASYNQSDDFTLTVYGHYFISQCKSETLGK